MNPKRINLIIMYMCGYTNVLCTLFCSLCTYVHRVDMFEELKYVHMHVCACVQQMADKCLAIYKTDMHPVH